MNPAFPLARGIPLTAETAPLCLGSLAAVLLWWWAALLFCHLREGRPREARGQRLALYLLPPLALLSAVAACTINF